MLSVLDAPLHRWRNQSQFVGGCDGPSQAHGTRRIRIATRNQRAAAWARGQRMLRFFASLTAIVWLCACAFGAEGNSPTLVASASALPMSSAPSLTIRKQVEEVR